MAQYVHSDDIQVFPSAKRVEHTYVRDARLLSETNLVRLINELTDTDSFVISDDFDGALFEFNIHGYYFKVKVDALNALGFSQGGYLVASIILTKLEEDSEISDFSVLNKADEDSMYHGVEFYRSDALPSDGSVQDDIIDGRDSKIYRLAIGEWNGEKWVVPFQSKLKFKSSSIKNIDGGIIL